MPVANPYARPVAAATAAREKENGCPQPAVNIYEMGPQSQRHHTLQERTHQMQSQSKKKGTQLTLNGGVAFDPTKNCQKCRGGPNSHKGHDQRCWNNKRRAKLLQAIEDQRLKLHFSTPLTKSEKCSGKYLTKETAVSFFAPRGQVVGGGAAAAAASAVAVTMTMMTTTTTVTAAAMETATTSGDTVTANNIYTGVTKLLDDSKFYQAVKSTRAPLGMLAFAN